VGSDGERRRYNGPGGIGGDQLQHEDGPRCDPDHNPDGYGHRSNDSEESRLNSSLSKIPKTRIMLWIWP
jgi:hypothetical protein